MSNGVDVALELLEQAFKHAPEIADIFARGLKDAPADDPIAPRVRARLPAEGASARALRELERERTPEEG